MEFLKHRYLLIAIFLAAFLLRFIIVLHSNNIPSSDDAAYDKLGLYLSQGKGYINEDGSPHSFYPPFYPFILSVIYRVFGHSYIAVRIFQSALGALTCVLVYLIGRKLHGASVGAIASFISIIYYPFIKSAELLLTEQLFTFILCLIIFYLAKIQEKAAGFKNYVILGLLTGLSLLTRSSMIIFPLFILPLLMYLKKTGISAIKKYIIIISFFILSIVPWALRNYNIYNKFVPVATQGGITFYSSYFPKDGIFGLLAAQDDPVVIESNKINSPALKSDFLVKKTLEFIINNPKKVLMLELKKILYFWAPFDWEMTGRRWFNFIYAAILPFFVLGVFCALKGFMKNYAILLPIIYFQIMILIFYGSPRFRLPIDPYIFILSAIGIFEGIRIYKRIRRLT